MQQNAVNTTSTKNICTLHQQTFELFCENCMALVCRDCISLHTNHLIVEAQYSYREKIAKLTGDRENLLILQKSLVEQRRRIQNKITEVKLEKEQTERDAKSKIEASAMPKRDAYQRKETILDYEISSLNNSLSKLSLFINSFEKKDDKLLFLKNCSNYAKDADYLASTHIPKIQEEKEEDKEAKPEKLENTSNYYHSTLTRQDYDDANSFKNELLWKLINEIPNPVSNKEKSEYIQSMRAKIEKYKVLAQRDKQVVDNYDMQCMFCREVLTPQTVNTLCKDGPHFFISSKQNSEIDQSRLLKFFTPTKDGKERSYMTPVSKVNKDEKLATYSNSPMRSSFLPKTAPKLHQQGYSTSHRYNCDIANLTVDLAKPLSICSNKK